MDKRIIFLVVVVLTAILAVVENATIGLPVADYKLMSICGTCGICLSLGMIYMRLSLYKTKHILWCLAGGVSLTMFIVIGAHFANLLPVAIDYFRMGALSSLILSMLTALYMIGVYAASLYFFVFYFCEMRDKIRDFK